MINESNKILLQREAQLRCQHCGWHIAQTHCSQIARKSFVLMNTFRYARVESTLEECRMQ